MSKPIGLMEVKAALRDQRFRDRLPDSFKEEIQKYLQNPGCSCNVPIYKKVMTQAKSQLQEYYPNRSIANLEEESKKLVENKFSVISCHVDELESKLRNLPSGRKQLAVARFEDQITVIVNELDAIY